MATWQDWVKLAETLGFIKVVIINRTNDTVLAKNKNADITSMFQFKPTWKSAKNGEFIVSNWFRISKINTNLQFPNDVKNLCLTYAFAVNEMSELKKEWNLPNYNKTNNTTKPKAIGSIHLFGDRYFVVHRDERNGGWIVGRLLDECVIALQSKSLWFVVSSRVKPRSNHLPQQTMNNDKKSKVKPIQTVFADFWKQIGTKLIDF